MVKKIYNKGHVKITYPLKRGVSQKPQQPCNFSKKITSDKLCRVRPSASAPIVACCGLTHINLDNGEKSASAVSSENENSMSIHLQPTQDEHRISSDSLIMTACSSTYNRHCPSEFFFFGLSEISSVRALFEKMSERKSCTAWSYVQDKQIATMAM